MKSKFLKYLHFRLQLCVLKKKKAEVFTKATKTKVLTIKTRGNRLFKFLFRF